MAEDASEWTSVQICMPSYLFARRNDAEASEKQDDLKSVEKYIVSFCRLNCIIETVVAWTYLQSSCLKKNFMIAKAPSFVFGQVTIITNMWYFYPKYVKHQLNISPIIYRQSTM